MFEFACLNNRIRKNRGIYSPFFKKQRRLCSCQCKPTWRRVRLLLQWF